MTTRDAIKFAENTAKDNDDMLVLSCLCVIEALYITGEIKEVAELLITLAKKKLAEASPETKWEF